MYSRKSNIAVENFYKVLKIHLLLVKIDVHSLLVLFIIS